MRLATASAFNTPLEMRAAGAQGARLATEAFNTPLEMRRRAVSRRDGLLVVLSILHWRCDICRQQCAPLPTRAETFNTPLEMQYDSRILATTERYKPLSILHWRCSVRPHRHLPAVYAVRFQYSIGDAGGSCLWFLWVFKFLCRCVWVSAAACWLWLFWFCFLCRRAEKRGVGVCVFFLLGVGLR